MSTSRPRFFFDVGLPECWLAAEQIDAAFGEAIEWIPVSQTVLARETRRRHWGDHRMRDIGMSQIEERVRELGLGPLTWPYPWPNDSCRAMRVAVFARTVGSTRRFALAAFRLQFLAGERISDWHVIASAVRAADMPGRPALDAPLTEVFQVELRTLTRRALQDGVISLPAFAVHGTVLHGEESLADARRGWDV